MADKLRKVWICILGILQGFAGSYMALMGYVCAFPDTMPGDKDYEEDGYSSAMEPPVRCPVSHSTAVIEPPRILCRERLFT